MSTRPLATSYHRATRAIPVLAWILAGCTGGAERTAVVTLLLGEGAPRPDHARLTWATADGRTLAEGRVPPRGAFGGEGAELATVHVAVTGRAGEPRSVAVRGFVGDEPVVAGTAEVTLPAAGTVSVTVVLRAIPADAGVASPDAGAGPDAPEDTPSPSPADGPADPPAADAPEDPRPPPADAEPPDASTAERPIDAAPDAPLALTRGLVGYWKLDEGTGTFVGDSSGNRLGGTIRNPAPGDWTDGQKGGALAFTGRNWVRIPPVPALETILTEVTIAAWIHRTANQSGSRVILQRQISATPIAEHYALQVVDNRLYFGGLSTNNLFSPSALPLSRWIHVAGVFDGAAIRLYVDGAEVARASRRGTFTPDTTPLTMGAGINTTDQELIEQHLQARLDEVVLYARALSAAEVAALAAGQSPR